ncbi:hypothetical protein Ocin01_14137 [Orchesella cincta]|uniref:LEM domain-containing protein n=1 Tax=Orchesella cincta TaxID=48709 RepID=A0A1D2MHU6_ORCCI|nr:hypothetical protein Ocin01_14137 [Orchesella cincta]
MFISDDIHRLVVNLGYESRREKWVARLSDRNLFDALTACDRNVGPVLDSTRDLYRKMLIDLLKTGSTSQIVESIDNHLGSNQVALEHWEKTGMQSYRLTADDRSTDDEGDKSDKSSNAGSDVGSRRRTPTPSRGLSYASALSRESRAAAEEEFVRESTPPVTIPRTPRKLSSPLSAPSWPDLGAASAAEQEKKTESCQIKTGSFDDGFELRKREKGGSQVRECTKDVQGNSETGRSGQAHVSNLKILILALICGFSIFFAIFYYRENFYGSGPSQAEIEMEPGFKDELDYLIEQVNNIGGAEQA